MIHLFLLLADFCSRFEQSLHIPIVCLFLVSLSTLGGVNRNVLQYILSPTKLQLALVRSEHDKSNLRVPRRCGLCPPRCHAVLSSYRLVYSMPLSPLLSSAVVLVLCSGSRCPGDRLPHDLMERRERV